ncbi:hypothetical protein ACVJF1_004115 [Bradyrhizobium diazoefficiens]
MRASRGGNASARRLLPSAVMRPSPSSALSSLRRLLASFQAGCGGGSRNDSAAGFSDAPLRQIEHERGQIGAEDFRLGVGRERRRLRLVPEPVADARLGAAGAAAALIHRRARGAHGLEPGQADIRLVARHAGKTGIDDNAHAFDGERGLRDRGRQHHLARALRRGRNGAILHGGIERAEQRHDLDTGVLDALAEEILGAADFSGAGQERQHRTAIGAQRRGDRIRHLPLDRRVRLAAEIARLDRKGAALAFDDGRLTEQLCDAGAVERCRHHENAQILAQAGLRVTRQRKAHVGVERTLVKFVEQDGGNAGELGIVHDLAGEDAFGHDLDARRARYFRAETDAVADGLTCPLAERFGHAIGAGARRDAPRLQHDDLLALGPGRIEQRQRHARGLAGAGRGHQHGRIVCLERARQIVEHGIDREGRVEAAGQRSRSVITREGG